MSKKLRVEHSGDNNNGGVMEIDFGVPKQTHSKQTLGSKRRQLVVEEEPEEIQQDNSAFMMTNPLRMAKLMHMPRITKFVKISAPLNLTNQNGYNALYGNGGIAVSYWSSSEGYSQYFALYRKYRVVKQAVKHEYLPTPNEFKINSVHTMTAGTTSSSVLKADKAFLEPPEFAFWADNTGSSPTYGNTDADWQNIMNRENLGWHKGHVNYFEWFPRPKTIVLKNTTSTAETPLGDNPWISTDETAIKYLGCNVYINNKGSNVPASITATNWQKLIWTEICWVEFKDPLT